MPEQRLPRLHLLPGQALGKKAHELETSIQQAEQTAAKKLEALDEAPCATAGRGP